MYGCCRLDVNCDNTPHVDAHRNDEFKIYLMKETSAEFSPFFRMLLKIYGKLAFVQYRMTAFALMEHLLVCQCHCLIVDNFSDLIFSPPTITILLSLRSIVIPDNLFWMLIVRGDIVDDVHNACGQQLSHF